jgi:hypothetical protein
VNTDWLYSSDYVRVRDITVGYNLGNLTKKKVVQNARLYITAENFFGHDKYYGGANPDASNTDLSGNGNYLSPGDYGGLPLAKSLIIGLNKSKNEKDIFYINNSINNPRVIVQQGP